VETLEGHKRVEVYSRIVSLYLNMRFIQDSYDWYKRNAEIHGIAMLLLASFIYFSQGSRGPIGDTVFYVGTYEYSDVDSARITKATADSTTPWTLKFLFGLISDNLPIFGYNAKPYMLLACVIGFFGIGAIGMPAITNTFDKVAIGYVVSEYYGAIVDCLGDSLIIKSGKKDEEDSTSGLQSVSWFAFGVGGAIFTLVGSQMMTDRNSPDTDNVSVSGARAYPLVAMVFPVVLMLLLFIVKEERTKVTPGFKSLLQQLVRLLVVLFSPPFLVLRVGLWTVISGASFLNIGAAMQTFVTNEIDVAPDIQGYLNVSSYAFLSLGVTVYYRFFRFTSFRWIFGATQLVLCLFYLLDYILVKRWNVQAGINDIFFLFATGAFSQVIDRLNAMPFLVMAGQLCPDNMEATFFAAMMSISNQGSKLASQFGEILLTAYPVEKGQYEQLPTLILIRSAVVLCVIIFLPLVPNTSSVNPANLESLNPTNPFIIRLLKFADLYNPHGDLKLEDASKENSPTKE
jgi:hypothetical protein